MIDKFDPPKTQKCEILYTGTLSDYRYDTLLQALTLMKQSSPDLVERLHLRFVGEGTDSLERDAGALGLSQILTTEGPTTQEQVDRLTKQSHALLMLGRSATMKGYELFAGAKLFGYLKAGMPIIGVLPSDETRNVLLRVGAGTVADVESPSEVVEVLKRVIDAWLQSKLSSLVPDGNKCKFYSSERQSRELLRALEGTPALEPFVAGSAEIPPSLKSTITSRAREFVHEKFPGNKQNVIPRSQT